MVKGGAVKTGRRFFITAVLLLVVLAAANLAYGEGYVIGEEDVVQISVWGSPELTVTVPVKPDGTISMHLIGDVKAAGLTPRELKAELEKGLSKFLKTPTVSVIVTDVNSFKIFVIGEGVASQSSSGGPAPLVLTFKRDTTLMQMLAHLGSLRNADLSGAYILRDGKKLDNNFSKLMTQCDLSQDIMLKPNDTIFIPDNFDKRITVLGAVKTPTVQPYRKGLTVVDAVLAAGGVTDYANQNNVLVVRREGGKIKNIVVDLKDVMEGGDVSKDIPLMPGDHIIVKTGLF